MYNADGELTERCSKSFPKDFLNETVFDGHNSYVKYKRRDPKNGGTEAVKDDKELDSSWIVPYNPYLMLRYGCHINVEVCASNKATKYLHKYITKGGDRNMMGVEGEGPELAKNEVREFQDLRSFGSSESCWRLLEFEMSDR